MKVLVRRAAALVSGFLFLVAPNAFAQATSADALIEQYYMSILGRASDAGGKAFWLSEVARTTNLGVDVKESFMVMAGQFFTSAEYASRNRTDLQFVDDLYLTFFNRTADSGGEVYWTGLLDNTGGNGVARGVLMNGFMFSPEFAAYMVNLPGNATSRPEIYASVDFYRGVLGRLPDNNGFNYWLNQFQTSQCSGSAMVYASVESISSSFVGSPEYAARNRSNTDYVSDLYYAFLRRSADQAGFQYWVSQLTGGTQTRDQLRKAFIASPEFTGRVNAIISKGCVPNPGPCTLTAKDSLGNPVSDVPASCSTTVSAACNVTLTTACTGGTPTSYGWNSTVNNATLAVNTAPPVVAQTVAVQTPQGFTAMGGNVGGVASSTIVPITVGGVGGGGGNGPNCTAQGFATTHYIKLPLNQNYTLSTWQYDKNTHIPPDTMGIKDVVVIEFAIGAGAQGRSFSVDVTGHPYQANLIAMSWSTDPCDWTADSTTPGVVHFGPDNAQTINEPFNVGGTLTGQNRAVLPPNTTMYLIISNRYPSTFDAYGFNRAFSCDGSRGCDMRIANTTPSP